MDFNHFLFFNLQKLVQNSRLVQNQRIKSTIAEKQVN